MSDRPSQIPRKESKLGTNILILCAVVGALWAGVQAYNHYNQKEERIVATGIHAHFETPSRVRKSLYDEKRLISKPVKESLPGKDTIFKSSEMADMAKKFLIVLDVIEKKEAEGKAQLKELNALETFRQIEITNQGEKEAENISLEIEDSVGFYQVGENDDAPSGSFNRSIPVGNLRPAISAKVFVWSSDTHYSWRNVLVSHKNGAGVVVFPQDLPFGEHSWNWPGIVWYSVIALVLLGIAFGSGFLIGNKELRENMREEEKVIKEFREKKKRAKEMPPAGNNET